MIHSTAPQINLLSKKKAVFDELSELALRVRVISGVVLIVYVVAVIFVFSLSLIWNSKITAAQSSFDQVRLSLATQGSLVQQYEQSVSNLKKISIILEKRHEAIDLWTKLQQLVPTGCEVTAFSLEKDVLRASVSAPHVILANQVIDMIEKDLRTNLGASTFTSTISRGEDAAYRIDLEITLQQKGNGS